MNDMDFTVEKVDLVKDNRFGVDEYYLDVTYTVTGKLRKIEYHFPRVKLPFSKYFSREMNEDGEYTVNFGFGDLVMCADEKHPYKYTTRIVEEYEQEMTLEEIEKALGYKVKIVDEKKKEEK